MDLELAPPLTNLGLTAALTLALLTTLFVLNRITWHGVVQPLSGFFFGHRQRTFWFHLVVLPGTVIHECSHLLACWVLLVPVVEFKPFAPDPNPRQPLGWVRARPTDPLRHTLVALAPFLGGSLALLALSRLAFPALYGSPRPLGLDDPGAMSLWTLFGQMGRWVWNLWTSANYLDWQTWLFLYLAFSIGLVITPSEADFQALPGGLALAALSLGGCYLLGLAFQVDWALLPPVANGLSFLTWLLTILNHLFAYSAGLITLSVVLFAPLAMLLAHLRG